MKEWKATEKETQKMTRDGAISVNMVTGEVSRTSDRAQEQDYSPANDSTAFVHSAVECLDDRHIQKSEKKKRKKRHRTYREGTAVGDRPSSRLQFSEEELATPELQKAIRKSDKAADRLDAAKAAIPKKRTLGTERVFDEERGTGHTRLVFKESDKPATIREHTNPLSRPLQEIGHAAHAKVHEVEQENAGVESGHLAERGMEKAVSFGNRKFQNWRQNRKLQPWREAAKAEQQAVKANADFLYQKAMLENPQLASSNPISRMWQKKRLQKQYAAAYRAAHTAGDAAAAADTAAKGAKQGTTATKKAGEFIAKHKKAFLLSGGIGLLLVLMLGLLQSCTSMFGGGVSNIVASSYLSEDADLLAAEEAYCAMEDELREYLDDYELTHDYDEYHFDLDDIAHDPYVLLSILSALHEGTFTIAEVQADLQMLICCKLLCASASPYEYETVTATFDCGGHTFTAKGKRVLSEGWREIDRIFRASLKEKPEDTESGVLPDFIEGQIFENAAVTVTEHFTSPPKPYTEDTLLSAMENAGKEDIPEDAERKGLGTPATRAAIIEKLVTAGFVERNGKNLIPTKAGINLVSVLPEPLTSPMLTAEWEQKLTEIAKGNAEPTAFMDGIRAMVQEIVSTYSCISEDGKKLFAPEKEVIGNCPRCGKPVYEGKKNFACSDRSCTFVLWKNDRFWTSRKKELTKKMAADLLKKGYTNVKGMWSEKKGSTYDATVILDDTGEKFIHFKLEFPNRKKN